MKFKTDYEVVLASSSPRRRELLSSLGIPFRTETSSEPETIDDDWTPEEAVMGLAQVKAASVHNPGNNVLTIGADTVVSLDGEILHKPENTDQAKDYLRRLSGRTHQVHTGVAIMAGDYQSTFYCTTNVTFRQVSEELMDAYVSTGDPFDKAGGYGIQTIGGLFVESIEGDYNTVVGLPISELFNHLYQSQLIQIVREGEEDAT